MSIIIIKGYVKHPASAQASDLISLVTYTGETRSLLVQ